MRHKRVLALLIVTAALCVAVNATRTIPGAAFSSVLAFPFQQLGAALRALSLSGAAGNAAAVALYCAASLLPTVYLALRVIKRRARAEDALLAVLSAVLLAVLYMMVNPADISRFFGVPGMASTGMGVLGGAVYSVVLGYIVLRALRVFSQSGERSLLRYLYVLLALCGSLLVIAVFGTGLSGMLGAFRQFAEGNTDGAALGTSHVFIALQHIVDALPYLLNIVIILSALDLIAQLQVEPYSDAAVNAARRLGRVCRGSIVAVMLSQIALNVLQLAYAKLVRSSHYSFSIPLLAIAFALAALLLAKYFERGKELKDEGDMFI